MATFRMLLLSSIFILLSSFSSHASLNKSLELWQTTYINKMSPAELQILGNFIYISSALAIIESKIKQFTTPIARLNQAIRIDIETHKNPADNLATLKTLLDRLSYVAGARSVYTETLATWAKYYNEHNSPLIDAAVNSMQLNAQTLLREWADNNVATTNEYLKESSDIMINYTQYIQVAMGLYKGLSENELPFDIPKESEQDKTLITFDIILKNNPEILKITEQIINTINETSDYTAQIINVGAEIYKHYYAVVYNTIMAPSNDKTYTTTMFSMYGTLTEEYKTVLPDVNHIFEHALQTTKLYTQTEVLQHS